jgi:hypothetical protein
LGEVLRNLGGRAGKLESWCTFEIGEAEFTGDSEPHGIETGTKVLKGWCCQDAENIWELEDEAPPCHVCPRYGFQLSANNERLVRAWRMLDLTGRDRMFEAGFLREEAIDVALTRYGMNSPRHYERLIYVDVRMLEHRQKTKPTKKKGKGS